eukprot:TRINITY_DN19428_c0_g1_i1.p2 TRINITY_DN19428_c0_g1~~TRINITY_DN19428_c0_g1_i1.p2  ORF type:complete len:243 (-),score=34.68 TRINITY_DN19428_c0_g1_i1:280-1008(-)
MAAVSTSMASSLSVKGLNGAFVAGKSFRSAVRLPAVVGAARLVAEARQEKAAASSASIASAASSVVESVFGEKASRQMTYSAIIAMNAMIAMPALAEEKGKIFDFNLTLPIIAVQFLLLMVTLDNIWFKPVAKVMDSRDEEIRSKLMGVRDNSGEIKSLQSEAEALIKTARAEASRQMGEMKRELAAELDAKLQAYRARIEKELESALANLDKQKVDTMKSLDSQVSALSDEIVKKVIPFKA